MNLATFFENNAVEMQTVCKESDVKFEVIKTANTLTEVTLSGNTNDLREMVAVFCAMAAVSLLRNSYPPRYLANNGTWQDFAVDIASILKYEVFHVMTFDIEDDTQIWSWKF